jgi:transcriptional regulator with XRE-family HTH domain
MHLVYDPNEHDFFIGEVPLKDFYIQARKESGISINKLEQITTLAHPTLSNIERGNGKKSNSTRAMLATLPYLGYNILIIKRNKPD